MLKCPFCHFENEEGVLFCEQCKSDLAGVTPTIPADVAMAQVVEAMPVSASAGSEPVSGFVEVSPVVAEAAVVAVAEVAAAIAPPEAVTPLSTPSVASVPQAFVPADMATPPPTAPAAPPPTAPGAAIPEGAQVRLLVLRGLKRNVEYPIYEGLNFIGRADEKPVDIDLEDQEPPDRIWSSRQHAVVSFENSSLAIEDLNSSNGTFVNRQRIYPGQKQQLNVNDVIQIGTVQLKIIV